MKISHYQRKKLQTRKSEKARINLWLSIGIRGVNMNSWYKNIDGLYVGISIHIYIS